MSRIGKGWMYEQLNEGKGIRIDSYEKEKELEESLGGNPTYGADLVGLWNQETGGNIFVCEYGGIGTPFSKRNLFDNNSQKTSGSRIDWVSEDEAREWLEEHKEHLDGGGNVEKLDKYLDVYEQIQDLKS